MVERTEEEYKSEAQGGTGFGYVPAQEFPELGDQFDRDVKVHGPNPAQLNTKWYDYTPTQRYGAILTSWLAVGSALKSGMIGQLDDETIIIAGYAAKDPEALEAGQDLMKSETYASLRPVHDLVYGEGIMTEGDLAGFKIPKINVNDPNATYDNLYAALGGTTMTKADTAVQRSRIAFGDIRTGDPYQAENQGTIISFINDKLGDAAWNEASAADLLKHVNDYSHLEEDNWAGRVNNAQDFVSRNAIDTVAILLTAKGAGKVIGGTFGLTVKAVRSLVPTHIVAGEGGWAARWVVDAARGIKQVFGGDHAIRNRRIAQAGAGGVATATIIGKSLFDVALESDEESYAALLEGAGLPEQREIMDQIMAESFDPLPFNLRHDSNGWFQNRDKRRQMSIDDMRTQAGKSRYGSTGSQPGSEQQRTGYSFFNPEVRQGRKDTSLKEIQEGPSYNVNQYQTGDGNWELR